MKSKIKNLYSDKINKLIDKKALLFSFILWVVLNFSGIQKGFFTLSNFWATCCFKISHYIFLYFIFYLVFTIFKYKNTNTYKIGRTYFLIYLLIVGLLLILVWPGIWSWDDINLLLQANNYWGNAWQHIFSSIIYILFLETIPFASGVLIMQIIIAGVITGYCVSKVSTILSSNYKMQKFISVFLFLPTILLPLLLFILSGFRMALYSYFELLLITEMFVMYKEQKQLTFLNKFWIIILLIFVASWRTEAVYYPICFGIFLFLNNKIVESKKEIIILTIFSLTCVFAIGVVNNKLIGTKDYSITATVLPIKELVKHSDFSDSDNLEKIDKILDVNFILEHPDWDASRLFWFGALRNNYSDQDYKDYMSAYAKMVLKYPVITFNAMWEVFYGSSGLGVDKNGYTKQLTPTQNALALFDTSTRQGENWEKLKSPLKYPFNSSLRNTTIKILSNFDKNNKVTSFYYIFWNLFIPIILLLACLVLNLIQKKWSMSFIILTLFARLPMLFIASSVSYFMYYLSFYLCAYFVSFIVIIDLIIKLKKQKNINVVKSGKK